MREEKQGYRTKERELAGVRPIVGSKADHQQK
jgi:hypothetical protein